MKIHHWFDRSAFPKSGFIVRTVLILACTIAGLATYAQQYVDINYITGLECRDRAGSHKTLRLLIRADRKRPGRAYTL